MKKLIELLICLLLASSFQNSKNVAKRKQVVKSLTATNDSVRVCSVKWDSIEILIKQQKVK